MTTSMQSMDAHRVMLAALLIATAGVAQSRVVAFGLPVRLLPPVVKMSRNRLDVNPFTRLVSLPAGWLGQT